jgi:hypothetical protein
MIVAIDARDVRQPLSGIGRYTNNLICGLQIAGDAEVEKIVLLTSSREVFAGLRGDPRFVFEPAPDRRSLLKAGRAVRRILARHRVDVLHTPDAFGLLASNCRRVITIHDLIPIRCRHWLHRSVKSRAWPLWLAWLRLQASRCDHIVTVSEFSRLDIMEALRVPADRVSVVYNGIAAPQDSAGGGRQLKETLPGKIVYVGRRDPYKNIDGLIRAFAALRGRVPFATLRIVGAADGRYRDAERLAATLRLGSAVEFSGYLDEASLDMAYRQAAVLVFPSFYEGFGLPPLEAMARGVPVVASNRASIPEILGDAALLVDPADVTAMAAAITRVLTDRELAENLAASGLRQVKKFSLVEQGRGTISIYKHVLASGCG